MFKWRRYYKWVGLGALPILPLAAISAVSSANTAPTSYLLFQGKAFTSANQALQYYLANAGEGISREQVVGDFSRPGAYLDASRGVLNKALFPTLAESRLAAAYQDYFGDFALQSQRALATYSDFVPKIGYTFAGAQQVYLTESEARAAAQNLSLLTPITVTELVDPAHLSNDKIYLNPVNRQDVAVLKARVLANLANIKQATSGPWSVSYYNAYGNNGANAPTTYHKLSANTQRFVSGNTTYELGSGGVVPEATRTILSNYAIEKTRQTQGFAINQYMPNVQLRSYNNESYQNYYFLKGNIALKENFYPFGTSSAISGQSGIAIFPQRGAASSIVRTEGQVNNLYPLSSLVDVTHRSSLNHVNENITKSLMQFYAGSFFRVPDASYKFNQAVQYSGLAGARLDGHLGAPNIFDVSSSALPMLTFDVGSNPNMQADNDRVSYNITKILWGISTFFNKDAPELAASNYYDLKGEKTLVKIADIAKLVGSVKIFLTEAKANLSINSRHIPANTMEWYRDPNWQPNTSLYNPRGYLADPDNQTGGWRQRPAANPGQGTYEYTISLAGLNDVVFAIPVDFSKLQTNAWINANKLALITDYLRAQDHQNSSRNLVEIVQYDGEPLFAVRQTGTEAAELVNISHYAPKRSPSGTKIADTYEIPPLTSAAHHQNLSFDFGAETPTILWNFPEASASDFHRLFKQKIAVNDYTNYLANHNKYDLINKFGPYFNLLQTLIFTHSRLNQSGQDTQNSLFFANERQNALADLARDNPFLYMQGNGSARVNTYQLAVSDATSFNPVLTSTLRSDNKFQKPRFIFDSDAAASFALAAAQPTVIPHLIIDSALPGRDGFDEAFLKNTQTDNVETLAYNVRQQFAGLQSNGKVYVKNWDAGEALSEHVLTTPSFHSIYYLEDKTLTKSASRIYFSTYQHLVDYVKDLILARGLKVSG